MKNFILAIFLMLATSYVANAQMYGGWGNAYGGGYGSFYGGYGRVMGQSYRSHTLYEWDTYYRDRSYRQVIVINGRAYYGNYYSRYRY